MLISTYFDKILLAKLARLTRITPILRECRFPILVVYYRNAAQTGDDIVKITLMIENLSKINEKSMDYEMSVILRTYWYGEFQPSIFFVNEKMHHKHYSSMAHQTVKNISSGENVRTEHLSVLLSCSLNMTFYEGVKIYGKLR